MKIPLNIDFFIHTGKCINGYTGYVPQLTLKKFVRMKFLKIAYILLLLWHVPVAFAQNDAPTLGIEQVLNIVRSYHPVLRSAELEIRKSEAGIIAAKGAFDPVFSNNSSKKTFDGKNYYQYQSPELRIPTWYGVELYAGTESLQGDRVDPTETLGKTSYVGLNVPLAKYLLMDKRRAALKQSKIIKTLSEIDRRALANDVLLDAAAAYWAWVQAYQVYQIVSKNVALNEQRLDFVKKSLKNGERAGIDTVEAATQLQQFKYLQNQQWLNFQNTGLELAVYLWTANEQPAQLPAKVVPEQTLDEQLMEQPNLEQLLEQVIQNHPELALYEQKQNMLDIDKSLKFQELLPKIDFKYNQLGKGYRLLETATTGPLFQNNFQYGLKIEMPLRLSQGRGEYKIAQLKIQQNTLARSQKLFELQTKVKTYFNEFQTLKAQRELLQQNYNYNYQLLKAEEARFANGESSLFLINSRENKVLDTAEKLVELKAKLFKTSYSLKWAAGILAQ